MPDKSVILGLNAFHGDASAAIIVDGEIAAAVAEERLNRVKHAAGFPSLAIARVVEMAGVDPGQIEAICIGRDGRANRWRKLGFVLKHRPSLASAILPRLRARRNLADAKSMAAAALNVPTSTFARTDLVNVEHHLAHAASAFLGSTFDKAAIVTADGFGDFVSTSWGVGDEQSYNLTGRVFYPHSLGILYQAVTQFIGFPHYGDEGKTMGLSPYGKSRFVDELKQMISKTEDAFELNPKYFTHVREGVNTSWDDAVPDIGALYNQHWESLFGPPRKKGDPQTDREADLAMSVQALLEEMLFHILDRRHRETGLDNIVLAGGVALNCVFNGKIPLRSSFKHSYIFPAAGDDGLAIGAAWHYWSRKHQQRPAAVQVPLWGPGYTGNASTGLDLSGVTQNENIVHEELQPDDVFQRTAAALADGKIVGWFQGKTEFGPRALGARSILADPRGQDTKERLNARIKHREPFRPFAPSILAEEFDTWFEYSVESPAMLHAVPVREEKRAEIPAVTHVDGSGRVQTVHKDTHPVYHRLIQTFGELTGVPIVLNTSFNENEPIVCTPQEGLDCFLRTDMDVLILENLWFERVG